MKRLLTVLLVMLTFTATASAQDDPIDDLLEGFSTPPAAQEAPSDDPLLSGFDDSSSSAEVTEESGYTLPVEVTGYMKFGAVYNMGYDIPAGTTTDWDGLSRAKAELQLELGYTVAGWKLFVSGKGYYDLLYQMQDEDDYSDTVLDEYLRTRNCVKHTVWVLSPTVST